MKRTYREGSQGAAEQKANKTFVLVAGIIYLLVVLCFVAFPTYMRDCFQRAPLIVNILGLAMVGGSYFMVYNSSEQILPSQSGHWYWIVCVLLLVLGLCLSCGFQFSLDGLPNRP